MRWVRFYLRPSRNHDSYFLLFDSSREICPLLVHMIWIVSKKISTTPPEIRKIKINSLVQLFVYYCRYHSSLSVLCLLPMGLPCLERLLTDDLSSILIVGDNGIIFLVPLGVGPIHALKLEIACYSSAYTWGSKE